MGQYGMTEYYEEKLQEGLEYQDFVAEQLMKHGIFIGPYASRKYQKERGESMAGVEVKYDKKMAETGNIYFEVAEKTRPDIPDFAPSGIMRSDNTWLYLIGNYERAFMFSKRQLKGLYNKKEKHESVGIRLRANDTSQGFTISVSYVRKWLCLREFVFQEQ